MNRSARRVWLTLWVCFAWFVISVAPLWKYLSYAKAVVAVAAGCVSIAFAMDWLHRLNRRRRQISAGWFVALFLVLTAAFGVLYPISLRHTLNGGSDREDALRIELRAVGQHQYPYDARTYLGNPPTPLPGAMLLAAPFFAVGHIAWQNFLWLALFFCFVAGFFRYRATALLFLVVFLLVAPADLSDFTAGGDYLTNFFYFAIAVALFVRSLDRSASAYVPAAIFLGVTLSSRVVYAVALIPLLALVLQRCARSRVVLLFAIILITAAAITLPVFAPHPLAHLLAQLSQNPGKLRFIPGALRPQWTLPLVALVVACASFFVRMDLPRVFLLFGIAILAILVPPVVTSAVHFRGPVYEFSYLSLCALPISLWALTRYELEAEMS